MLAYEHPFVRRRDDDLPNLMAGLERAAPKQRESEAWNRGWEASWGLLWRRQENNRRAEEASFRVSRLRHRCSKLVPSRCSSVSLALGVWCEEQLLGIWAETALYCVLEGESKPWHSFVGPICSGTCDGKLRP